MKFNVNKKDFETELSRVQGFLGKDQSDITSQILISVSNGNLEIYATDYTIGAKVKWLSVTDSEDGQAIINGANILSRIKSMSDGDLSVSIKDEMLVIRKGRSNFKLPLFDSIEFPKFINYGDFNSLNIDSNLLMNGFKKVVNCIDPNNPKYELTGAFLNISKDKIEVVSTDTKRLSLVHIDVESDNELSLIVPKKAIAEMQKLFMGNVEILYSNESIVVKSETMEFFSKLVNGKFPDFNRIIPQSSEVVVKIDKLSITESLKQIMTVSNEAKITLSSNSVEIESISDDRNEAKTYIDVECDKDMTINANCIYIKDFIDSIVDSDFALSLNAENMPFVLESGNLKTIVMPIMS